MTPKQAESAALRAARAEAAYLNRINRPTPRVDWAWNPWVWALTFKRVPKAREFPRTNERPIIFSAPMIRALLAGAKTQTRRLNGLEWSNADPGRGTLSKVAQQARWVSVPTPPGARRTVAIFHDSIPDDPVPVEVVCPLGNVGDRLWVREGVRHTSEEIVFTNPGHYGSVAQYIADGAPAPIDSWGWKNKALPAIHMPRGVCRIVLEITEIRCERLQSITEADALAEGIGSAVVPLGSGVRRQFSAPGIVHTNIAGDRDDNVAIHNTAREAFAALWTSIHGEAP